MPWKFTFGTAGIYVAFVLVALAALIARVRGTGKPASRVQLGRVGVVINTLAVLWLAFETVNTRGRGSRWPRPARRSTRSGGAARSRAHHGNGGWVGLSPAGQT